MVDQADWRALLQPEIQDFISKHGHDDVRALALKKMPGSGWPAALILDQIKARQKAKKKALSFYKTDRFVLPNSDVFEQASSEACALYKASLFKGRRCVDLTGGCGVDAFHMVRGFDQFTVVERDAVSADILRHNASVLTLDLDVVNGDSHDYLAGMESVDLVYIDPQRRAGGRGGKFDFSMCSPDILMMLDAFKEKARTVMIKASPFLDIDKAIADLKYVHAVHVVEWDGQCKEVLYILRFDQNIALRDVPITAVRISDNGVTDRQVRFTRNEDAAASISYGEPAGFIFEPSPAFQKAAGFRVMAERYGLQGVHPHTHLYFGASLIKDFPGQSYNLLDVIAPKAADVARLGIESADIALRNYPGNVADLRRKLKLSDGGVHRIYGVTVNSGEKRLLICKKDM